MTEKQIADILVLFQVVDAPKKALITIINEEHPMPYNTVTLFTYSKHRYMILQDDTAEDLSDHVRNMFEEAMFIPSEGKVLHNPSPMSDSEKFATEYDGHLYYLWSYDKDE